MSTKTDTRRCEMPLPGADPDDPDGRCNTRFEPNHPSRKYCYDCAPTDTSLRKRACKAYGCQVRYTPQSPNQKYCSQQCSNRQKGRDYRERKRAEKIEQAKHEGRLADAIELEERADQSETAHIMRRVESILNVVNQRDSDGYHQFVQSGLAERVKRGEFTQKTIAEALETEQKNVSVWMRWYQADLKLSEEREDWEQPDEAAEALEDFETFRARYFRTIDGEPYVMKDFHLRWVEAFLSAIPEKFGGTASRGRQVQVMSPPRLGKTELVAHLCIWLVLRNPNIRILWVGGNGTIAEQAGGLIRDELENNEALTRDFCPPGETFKPKTRSGKSWTDGEFTVGTRTVSGIKSPTFAAVGCGGKVLSRDVDLLVGDDIVDEDSAFSPAEREKKKHWWSTAIGSRKTKDTARFAIGSRQHHLDLWGDMIDSPAWDTIVNSAHDLECPTPCHPHGVPAGHDALDSCEECDEHVDCMMWPEFRDMHWLQDQRAAFDNDTLWEMVYFNVTRPEGAVFLTRADLDGCCNLNRSVGSNQHGQPITPTSSGGLALIAGLDPASTGDQAAVLWGYDPDTQVRYLIDTDIQRGGGLTGAHDIIVRWHQQYGLKHWVIERNRYQDSILQASQITTYCSANQIHLEPTFTHSSTKWSPEFGVPYQMQLFKGENRKIDLPWSPESPETREKVRVYMRQLLNFEGEEAARKKRRKNDLVLAGWFPEVTIRTWRAEAEMNVVALHGSTPYPTLMGEQYAYPGAGGSGISLADDDPRATVHDIDVVRTG